MTWRAVALAALVSVSAVGGSGCHAQLENQPGGIDAPGSNGSNRQDASRQTPLDSSTTMTPDAAAAACPTGRVLFLNFEGSPLIKAATSDATLNHASWMGVASVTMPGYLAGNANRAQLIIDVTNAVKAGLTNLPNISIVTTRPPSGPYVMIGFGGTEAMVAITYRFAVQQLDCTDVVKNDLGWVFDDSGGTQQAANNAIGAVGFGLGLTGTTNTSGCMCGWLSNCVPTAAACTLSTSIPALANCNMNPQNEVAAFQSFCN